MRRLTLGPTSPRHALRPSVTFPLLGATAHATTFLPATKNGALREGLRALPAYRSAPAPYALFFLDTLGEAAQLGRSDDCEFSPVNYRLCARPWILAHGRTQILHPL